ncbi:DnaJ domain-containing protein [Chloroflexota bacterium]
MNNRFSRKYRYYEIIEVTKGATQEEIRISYRKLAKKYHLDSHPNDSEAQDKAQEHFKKINEAYQVLSDSNERAAYDNSLAECPTCYTHDVLQTTISDWRYRHCGCKFNPSRDSEIVEQIERAAIPKKTERS